MKSLRRIFFQAVADNSLQAGRDIARGFGKFGDFFFQNRAHGVGGRLAVEGTLAGNHFVQDGAEGKDVGTGVGGFTAHLLGRHVADSAHDQTGFGSRLHGWRVGAVGRGFRARELRETEVQNLDSAIVRKKKVFRFQVAMDDALS